MRILIVDDDQNIRKMLVRGLGLLGHETHEAENGKQALEAIENIQADIVLTDVFMPVMDGFEFLCELRRRGKEIPAIALSGGGKSLHGDLFLRVAEKLGVCCSLQKPFSITEVCLALDACAYKQPNGFNTEQAEAN